MVPRRGLTATAVLITAAISVPGCEEGGSSELESAQHLAEDLARQLNTERLAHERDTTRYQAELTSTEHDYDGVVLGWAATAAAVVILILLLARERRARRVLERLLRLLLDRVRESRGPPSS